MWPRLRRRHDPRVYQQPGVKRSNLIRVFGHPRSGTHYIAALLWRNFGGKVYRIYFGQQPHALPRPDVLLKRGLNIEIYRNKRDVMRSIWKLKERFGAGASTYQEFLHTPWSEQFVHHPNARTMSYDLTKEVEVRGGSTHFASIDMTPPEYHAYYLKRWIEMKDHPHVLLLSYGDLVENPEACIMNIAQRIRRRGHKFVPMEEYVGWRPIE